MLFPLFTVTQQKAYWKNNCLKLRENRGEAVYAAWVVLIPLSAAKIVTFGHYFETDCFQADSRLLLFLEGKHLYPLLYKLCLCLYPNHSLFLSPIDDDYSDTYNATYAVINNGERCFNYRKSDS